MSRSKQFLSLLLMTAILGTPNPIKAGKFENTLLFFASMAVLNYAKVNVANGEGTTGILVAKYSPQVINTTIYATQALICLGVGSAIATKLIKNISEPEVPESDFNPDCEPCKCDNYQQECAPDTN